MYFESHAHYDDERFKNDQTEVLNSIQEAGVDYVINAGASMKSSLRGLQLAQQYDFLYCAVGVHPHDVEKMTERDIETLKCYAKEKKVVAIGEIGLDFYYDHSPRELQRHWFQKQMALANEVDLPVIIHSRDADQECFNMIEAQNVARKGVIHCYSGSWELAQQYTKMGYLIGVGGVVTFPNARNLVETVAHIDIQNILIETDCPYLAPAPHRGQRNDSTNLKYVVEKIAAIKDMTAEEVGRITKNNAVKLFFVKNVA